MRRTLVSLFAVILLVSCACYAEKTEEFQNKSGATATGLRIVFYSSTSITGFGDSFSTVTPTGSAKEFLFSGGSVLPFGTFTVSWASSTMVKSYEWLTGDQQGSSTPGVKCTVTVSATYPNLREAIERAWDGAVICVEPGTYQLDTFVVIEHSITIRGMGQTASEVVITCPKYEPQAIITMEKSDVVAENLEVRYSGFETYDTSHLILKNVIVSAIMAKGESTVDIQTSLVSNTYVDSNTLGVWGTLGSHVSVRGSVIERVVVASGDVQLTVIDSAFRGPESSLGGLDHASLDIRDCTFDGLSCGINLVNFAGTVLVNRPGFSGGWIT